MEHISNPLDILEALRLAPEGGGGGGNLTVHARRDPYLKNATAYFNGCNISPQHCNFMKNESECNLGTEATLVFVQKSNYRRLYGCNIYFSEKNNGKIQILRGTMHDFRYQESTIFAPGTSQNAPITIHGVCPEVFKPKTKTGNVAQTRGCRKSDRD